MIYRISAVMDRAFSEVLCGIPDYVAASKKIQINIAVLRDRGLPQDDPRLNLSTELIETRIADDMKRLDHIVARSATLGTGITLALTIFFAGSAMIHNAISGTMHDSLLRMLVNILLFATSAYFLIGGFCALKVHQTKSIHVFSLEDELVCWNRQTRVERMLEILDLNREVVRKYANLTDLSYAALRNGIICAAILILIITTAMNVSVHSSSPIPA